MALRMMEFSLRHPKAHHSGCQDGAHLWLCPGSLAGALSRPLSAWRRGSEGTLTRVSLPRALGRSYRSLSPGLQIPELHAHGILMSNLLLRPALPRNTSLRCHVPNILLTADCAAPELGTRTAPSEHVRPAHITRSSANRVPCGRQCLLRSE